MRVLAVLSLSVLAFAQAIPALAVVPATPSLVAGIDHIKPDDLDHVLVGFCRANACRVVRHAGENLWDLATTKTDRPVTIGDASFFPPHHYYVEVWGDVGKKYMNARRMYVLKELLKRYGAELTPFEQQPEGE